MALFLFIGKGSDLSSIMSDKSLVDDKLRHESLTVICITDEVESENLRSELSMITAEDPLDGALVMKCMMDEKKIFEAKCILPQENLNEFHKIQELVFPPICKITTETFVKKTHIKCWDFFGDVQYDKILREKLMKMGEKESVQTLQSNIIPTDLFIHGYSKRYGGVSTFPGMNSLNLVYSLRKSDSIFVVNENSRRLCQYLGVNHEKYNLAKANHGDKVWIYEKDPPEFYDGIVTKTKGVIVASPAADCNMLLLADPSTKSCGAIHAGWKGILAGIVESAVGAMVSNYGSDPSNIKAALGPSLSVCCCEFDADDSIPFLSIGSDVVVWVQGKEKPHINLRLATTILLQKCGLRMDNIDDGVSGLDPTPEIATCTKCDPNKDFFSFRRDGAKFGNQLESTQVMDETLTDTGVSGFQNVQDDIFGFLGKMLDEIDQLPDNEEMKCRAQNLQSYIGEVRKIVVSFGERFTEESLPIESFQKIAFKELFKSDADFKSLKPVTSGNFGKVVFRDFRGQKVAVKILKLDEKKETKEKSIEKFKSEIATLRVITHENIIGFRGWGEHGEDYYLVMEHLDKNLHKYVLEHNDDDNVGLSSRITWAIAKQIMQAMLYLHSLAKAIVHADLKPDNILVDTQPIIPKPKICDFGLSRHEFLNDLGKGHVRYLPNNKELDEAKTMDDLFKFDVLAFGLVVLFMRTGKSPYPEKNSEYLKDHVISSPLVKKDGKYFIRRIELPPDLPSTVLGKLVKKCCLKKDEIPTFQKIQEEFFARNMENPFNLSEKGEFFECGFLKDTQIFVADSIVQDSNDEKYKPSDNPPGYTSDNLICAVEVKDAPYNEIRDDWEDLRNLYMKSFREFRSKAKKKEIDDNPTIALSELVTDRSGKDEEQKVELKFKQKTYCHHRAMREVWRLFEPKEKEEIIKCLSEVDPLYSNAFGLHVAILTNEGPGKAKKFVFTRRSNRPGVASPGFFTCGAVESCSIKDYLKGEARSQRVPNAAPELEYISLLSTAARGLEEELGLPLVGSDMEAITLNTIYLKFDNHEWGMCGFVDLTNENIRKENRFSFEKLNAAFTSGPKDKFEHWQIYGVDFELRTMVEWIRANHDKFASSAKIVVVKVLQAFFGVAPVANAFAKKM